MSEEDLKEVKVEYFASWYCPHCEALGDECDEGSVCQGEYFNVTCYECDKKYVASR